MKMFIAAAIGCPLLAAPLIAQPSGNAEILAIARSLDAAQQTGDRAALDRLLAADFLFVGTSGKVGGKQDFITGFTAPDHALEPPRIVDPLFIRASDDVAIVGGEAWLKGTDSGGPFVRHFRYADTFARRDGRWVAIYLQVTALPAR